MRIRCLMHAHKRMQIHEAFVYASRVLRAKRAHKTRQGTFGLCERERSNIGSANAEHKIPCADACDDAHAQNGRCVRHTKYHHGIGSRVHGMSRCAAASRCLGMLANRSSGSNHSKQQQRGRQFATHSNFTNCSVRSSGSNHNKQQQRGRQFATHCNFAPPALFAGPSQDTSVITTMPACPPRAPSSPYAKERVKLIPRPPRSHAYA